MLSINLDIGDIVLEDSGDVDLEDRVSRRTMPELDSWVVWCFERDRGQAKGGETA